MTFKDFYEAKFTMKGSGGSQYYYQDPNGVVRAVGDKKSMMKMNIKQAKAGNKGGSFSQNFKKYKVGDKIKEEVELDEKYDLYHKDFSGAMKHAYDYAKKKLGITVDPKEIDSKVATGPKKPSEGKTNKYRLKGKGGNLQIQVYNKGGSKPFELNMYKEEVEIDEAMGASAHRMKMLDKMGLTKPKSRQLKNKDTEMLVHHKKSGVKTIDKKDWPKFKKQGYTQAEQNESLSEASKTIDKVKQVVSKKQAMKIDGVMVDMFTASAISQIYDKVNDVNKKKMDGLNVTKLANLAMKMMKREAVEVNEAKRGGKILPPIPALTKAKIKHTHNQSSFKQNKTMVGVADKDYDNAKKIVGNMPNVMLHTEELNERNYRKEYDNYHSKPEQIANRSSRNSARRIMGDKAVKGKDVGHKDNNPLNNDPKNLQMEDPSENRREPRTRDMDEASKEGTIKIIKTKDNKFQVQRMTKGKFVNQGKPYKSLKDAEKVRSSGQHSMQFSHVEEKATDKRMRGWHKDYDFDQDRDIVKGFVSPRAKSMAKQLVKDAVPMVKATKQIRSKFPGMKIGAISDLLKKEGLPQAIKAKDSARRKEYNAYQKARRK